VLYATYASHTADNRSVGGTTKTKHGEEIMTFGILPWVPKGWTGKKEKSKKPVKNSVKTKVRPKKKNACDKLPHDLTKSGAAGKLRKCVWDPKAPIGQRRLALSWLAAKKIPGKYTFADLKKIIRSKSVPIELRKGAVDGLHSLSLNNYVKKFKIVNELKTIAKDRSIPKSVRRRAKDAQSCIAKGSGITLNPKMMKELEELFPIYAVGILLLDPNLAKETKQLLIK
jgi:uncharacterized protein (UPF0147 family)